MFRATVWPSSSQPYGWLAGLQSEKYQYRIDTVSSPDDGHIVARNM